MRREAWEVENRGDLIPATPSFLSFFSSLLCLPLNSVPHRGTEAARQSQNSSRRQRQKRPVQAWGPPSSVSFPPQCSTFPGHWGGSLQHKEGLWEGEEEEAPLAFSPPQSRVSHPPWGRAWVHSLRQNQEGKREGTAVAVLGRTHRQGRRDWDRWGMRIQGRGGRGEREERREKAESPRDALRNLEVALTPVLTVVPGAWGGEMVAAHSGVTGGLRLGNRLKGHHSRIRGAGGRGCSETTAELLAGTGRGVAATGFQQDCQMKGRWWAKPRLPASTGLLREGGWGEFHTEPSAPAGL